MTPPPAPSLPTPTWVPRRTDATLPVRGPIGAARTLTWLTAVMVVVAAASGVLYGHRGLYQDDPLLLPQFLGQDIALLGIGVPLLLVGMGRAARGSARGLMAWQGALFYILYWYYFYVAGVQFGPLFAVHVAIMATSLSCLVILLTRTDGDMIGRHIAASLPTRTIALALMATGAVFSLLWVASIGQHLLDGEPIDMVARAVYAIDLIVMLPASIAAGAGLWYRRPWAYTLTGPVLIKISASMLTLTLSGIMLSIAGEDAAAGPIGGSALIAVIGLWATIIYFRAIRTSGAATA